MHKALIESLYDVFMLNSVNFSPQLHLNTCQLTLWR